MVNERDPRIDPQPGDVLRGAELNRTFKVIERHDNGCTVDQSKPFGPKRVFIPASFWMKWAKTAEVLSRPSTERTR